MASEPQRVLLALGGKPYTTHDERERERERESRL